MFKRRGVTTWGQKGMVGNFNGVNINMTRRRVLDQGQVYVWKRARIMIKRLQISDTKGLKKEGRGSNMTQLEGKIKRGYSIDPVIIADRSQF